jgi:23S rRNA pseudouridine2605 synthase
MTDMDDEGVRLQKVLAAAGVGSRRASEQLIAEGRVEVDGQVVREMGLRIDPDRAVVRVDGVRVAVGERTVHLAMNKPLGVLSAMSDSRGRPNLGDYVGERKERIFHVGRLDADTEGLILLTNDGQLAHRLAHPSYEVPKTYVAEVQGPVPRDLGRRLRAGVELDDGPVAVDSFRLLDRDGSRVIVELVLHEGRNRLVRRLLAAEGVPVQRLARTTVGPVSLGDLRPGRVRPLTSREVGDLYSAVSL